jgi:hypothetical protein
MVKVFMTSSPHHKNDYALRNYKNVEMVNTIEDCDVVYNPSNTIDTDKPVIYGPHFSIFPDYKLKYIKNIKYTYVQPSQWVVDIWKNNPLATNLNMSVMPFGVDTEKFKPVSNKEDRFNVMIYLKRRKPEELWRVECHLIQNNIPYKIFNYLQRYEEEDYINYLKTCNCAIWLSAHESQGFALEETLSMDVPVCVWNVSSMNQEYGSGYDDISASSIPYWDDRCGEYFYNPDDFVPTFKKFVSKLYTYKPRDFVMEKLSMDVCEQRFLDVVKEIQ